MCGYTCSLTYKCPQCYDGGEMNILTSNVVTITTEGGREGGREFITVTVNITDRGL